MLPTTQPPSTVPHRILLATGEAFSLIELSGVVSWSEIATTLDEFFLHPNRLPNTLTLWDARAVTGLRLSPGDVCPDAPCHASATLAALAPARAGGRAALVSRDVLLVSLARVLPTLGPPTGREVRAFGGVEDAMAFLGRTALPAGMEEVASSGVRLEA